jgi:hypothetical protein
MLREKWRRGVGSQGAPSPPWPAALVLSAAIACLHGSVLIRLLSNNREFGAVAWRML